MVFKFVLEVVVAYEVAVVGDVATLDFLYFLNKCLNHFRLEPILD